MGITQVGEVIILGLSVYGLVVISSLVNPRRYLGD